MKPSMVRSTEEIGKVAKRVQKKLNEDAGLGLEFIDPDSNMDQIQGIITDLAESETFERGWKLFEDRVENYLEGYVDDCVHDNAGFQYEAGLSPKIERRATANCCKWCSTLAGVYDYSQVSNTGNDVFRRHRNCRCQVLYSPDGSRRRMQNAHSKKWTEADRDDRIKALESDTNLHPIEKGYREALKYRDSWERGSLTAAVEKFATGTSAESTKDGRKAFYQGKDYTIIYDFGGNYFRIRDNNNETKRCFLTADGSNPVNITVDGKTRGSTKDEYNQMTHILNTDSRGRSGR